MSVRIAEDAPVSQLPASASIRVSQNSIARGLVTLAALAAVYALLLALEPHRRLWFDELITYYIVKAPSWSRLFEWAHRLDLNPLAADYVIRRFSMAILGDSAIALRAPSIVAFYIASAMCFLYVRRKAGSGFATFAVLVLWYSPVFRYANEARPYPFVCMFFAALLLFWDIASNDQRPASAVYGVAAATLGLVTVHAFALFSLLPFLAAEVFRYRSRRKPDYALWAALVLPALPVILYLPFARLHSPAIFPFKFEAHLRKIPIFFLHVFPEMGSGMFAALLAAILAPRIGLSQRLAAAEKRFATRMTDLVMLAVFILNPVALIAVLILRHGPFWDRYCITSMIAIYLALVICVARRLRFHQLAGYCAAFALTCVLVTERIVLPRLHRSDTPQTAALLGGVDPDLPIVAASGLTFLEMDYYESSSLLPRLYYLMGRSAAVQYAHATMFEDLTPIAELKRDFPIRANVDAYANFIARHREFLVLGTYDYPEDWLLRKLAADGAALAPIGIYDLPYKDHMLYKVTMPADSANHR